MVLALVLGAICSVMACALAAYQIGMHLKYYNSPPFQRYIIRIIFMVPVYAVCSVTTLADPQNAVIVSLTVDTITAFLGSASVVTEHTAYTGTMKMIRMMYL